MDKLFTAAMTLSIVALILVGMMVGAWVVSTQAGVCR